MHGCQWRGSDNRHHLRNQPRRQHRRFHRTTQRRLHVPGAVNQAIDDTVVNSVNLGIPFVVTAGNSAADASTSSPARLGGPGGNSGVITVGATNIMEAFASFSNFGSNVDVLASGQDVQRCGITSNDAVQSRSGTSMSTPQVAGLADLIKGQEGKLTPTALKQRIVALSASGVISSVPALTATTLGNNGAAFA